MQLYHYPFKAMGTACAVQFYTSSKRQAQKIATQLIDDVLRLEQRYSRYRAESTLSAINRVAATGGR